MKEKISEQFKIHGDQLRELWGNGGHIIVEHKKYSVHKMSYGDYFLEPWGKEAKRETDPFPYGTLWMEKIDIKNNIYGIE